LAAAVDWDDLVCQDDLVVDWDDAVGPDDNGNDGYADSPISDRDRSNRRNKWWRNCILTEKETYLQTLRPAIISLI